MPPGLDTFTQVKELILFRAQEPMDGTSDFDAESEISIAEAWRDLTTRTAWLGLTKQPPGALITTAPVTTLALTIATTGSAVAGTLAPAPGIGEGSYAGRKIIPASKTYHLRITAHIAGAAGITLDAAPEALTSVATTIVQDEYDLATDLGVFVDGVWDEGQRLIRLASEDLMKTEYPSLIQGWPPRLFARVGRTRIRFATFPDRARRAEYPYSVRPDDPAGDTELVIDPHLRPALARGALARLLDAMHDARFRRTSEQYELDLAKALVHETRLRTVFSGGRASELVPSGYGS